MYDAKYCRYYDLIHSQKDYNKETEIVLDITSKYHQRPIKKVLDVGCGTGKHSVALEKLGLDVIAIDTSPLMIEYARMDNGDNKIRYIAGSVSDLNTNNFDIAVSLFYVINHILTINQLIGFFRAISERLVTKGIYIFDCWNGITAIRDLPYNTSSETFKSNGTEITVQTTAETNFMNQETVLHKKVEIIRNKTIDRFESTFHHILWTPKDLQDILAIAGMKTDAILKWGSTNVHATSDDWKIMFVCKKM